MTSGAFHPISIIRQPARTNPKGFKRQQTTKYIVFFVVYSVYGSLVVFFQNSTMILQIVR